MSPHEAAVRLIGLRQQALGNQPESRRAQVVYGEELAAWTDLLREGPRLGGVLNLLVTEIALDRIRHGLPAPEELAEGRATSGDPVDLQVEGSGPLAPADWQLVDRIAAHLSVFPEWDLTVRTRAGGVLYARPAPDLHAEELAP